MAAFRFAGAIPEWSRKYVNLGSFDADAREGALDGFRRMQNTWTASKGWEGAKQDLQQVQALRMELRKLERLHILGSKKASVDVKLSTDIQQSLSAVSKAVGSLSDGALRQLYRDSSIDKDMIARLGPNNSLSQDISQIDPYTQPASKAASVYENHTKDLSALSRVVDDDRKLTRLKIYAGKESSREELKKHWKEHPGKTWAGFRGAVAKALNPQAHGDEMDMALAFMGALGEASSGFVSSVVVYGKALHRSTTNPMLQWTKYGMSSCIAFAFDKEARAKMNKQMGVALTTGVVGGVLEGAGLVNADDKKYRMTPMDQQVQKISEEEFRDKCRMMSNSVSGLPNSIQKNLKGDWRVLKNTGIVGETFRTGMDYQSGQGYGVFSGMADLEKRKNVTGYLYGVIALDDLGSKHLREHNEKFGDTETASRDLDNFFKSGHFTGNASNLDTVLRNMDVSGNEEVAKLQGELLKVASGGLEGGGSFKNNPSAQKAGMAEMAKVVNKDFSTVLDLATVSSTRARVADMAVKNCSKAYRKGFTKLKATATSKHNKAVAVAKGKEGGVEPRNNMLDHLGTPGMVAAMAFCDMVSKRSNIQEGEYYPTNVLAETFNAQSNENRRVLAEEMGLSAKNFVHSEDGSGPQFLVDVSKSEHMEIMASMSYGIQNHANYLQESSGVGKGDPALRDLGVSLKETHASNIKGAHSMQYGPSAEAEPGDVSGRDGGPDGPDGSPGPDGPDSGPGPDGLDGPDGPRSNFINGNLDDLEISDRTHLGPELDHALNSEPVPDGENRGVLDEEDRDYSGWEEPNYEDMSSGTNAVKEDVTRDIQDAQQEGQAVRDDINRDTSGVQKQGTDAIWQDQQDQDSARSAESRNFYDEVKATEREVQEKSRVATDGREDAPVEANQEARQEVRQDTVATNRQQFRPESRDPAVKAEESRKEDPAQSQQPQEESVDSALDKPVDTKRDIPKPKVPDSALKAMNDSSNRKDLENSGGDSSIGLVAKNLKGTSAGLDEGMGAAASTEKGSKTPSGVKKPRKKGSDQGR